MYQWKRGKKARRSSIHALAGGLMLLAASGAFAQDWPQWRGPNRDGKLTGFVAPQEWPAQLTMKWKVTVGVANASPALVGDRLYVSARQGDNEVTLCLSAADGTEIWRDEYEAQAVRGAAVGHPGPRSSPAVAEGKVVTLGVAGILSCLNAADGKLLWRKDEFPGQFPTFYTGFSPIVVDGMVIAHLGGDRDGAVMAYDLASGEEKWRWAGDSAAYGSPILATVEGTKQVVMITSSLLVALDAADGKLLWSVPFGGGGRAYNSSTPIADGSTIYATGQGQGSRALRIVKTDAGFSAEEIWNNPRLGAGFNSPVLKDGKLFGLSERGNYYCIDAATGETLWTDPTRHDRFGAILDAGSVLLTMVTDGQLVAYRPGAEGYAEVARMTVSDSRTYAHPVISGNRVFVKDEETLSLWTID